MSGWQDIISNILLFLLVFGMSATVDIKNVKKAVKNCKAISINLTCQFLILPFLGYVTIKMFNLPFEVGVALLLVVSSPGGSYSNWWCSIFNADLGLSVTMTCISTLMSSFMLPLNLIIYMYAAFHDDTSSSQDGESVIKTLNYGVIFLSIGIVVVAITSGLFVSWKFPKYHKLAYIGGNISGVLLIIFGLVLSFIGDGSPTEEDNDQTVKFYWSILFPLLVGLLIATTLAWLARLVPPERITTGVETCYQNTGIATSTCLSLFSGHQLKNALRVPTLYGIYEVVVLAVYMIVAWKLNWTKAPKDENFCKVIFTSYELKDSSDNGNNDDDTDDKNSTRSNRDNSDGQNSSRLQDTSENNDDFCENEMESQKEQYDTITTSNNKGNEGNVLNDTLSENTSNE